MRITVLTGAGISAESGIRTFRATDGLWEEHRIEDVATPEGFRRDPVLVHRFYNMRRADAARAQPNAEHRQRQHHEDVGWIVERGKEPRQPDLQHQAARRQQRHTEQFHLRHSSVQGQSGLSHR